MITVFYGAMNEYLGLADLRKHEADQLWNLRDWLHRFTAGHSTLAQATPGGNSIEKNESKDGGRIETKNGGQNDGAQIQSLDGPSWGVLLGDAWRASFEGKYFTSIKFYDSFIQCQDKLRMLHFAGKIFHLVF